MIIAGPCSITDDDDMTTAYLTAAELKGHVDYFRCKPFLGGTRPEKYFHDKAGAIQILESINRDIMPVMIEVQSARQYIDTKLSAYWIGARNCQNYDLLLSMCKTEEPLFIKRHPGITIDDMIGIYDICKKVHNKDVYIIERGSNYLSRQEWQRWSISLNEVLRIKHERHDIFNNLVLDCSHSAGHRDYVHDIYNAMKAIHVKHFMFECTIDGTSKTDCNQIITTDELKRMITC